MSAPQEHLLTKCADGLVRTDAGDIPVCVFSTLSTCSVLRDLWESASLDVEHGKTVFPAPGGNPVTIGTALELVHGVLLPESLDLDRLDHAFAGCEYLGCCSYDARLLARLWALLRLEPATSPALRRYAKHVLSSPLYRTQCLQRLARAMPLWLDFRAFLSQELVPLEPDLARYLADMLVQFYPPVDVLQFLLSDTTTPRLGLELASDIVGSPMQSTYYHPAEALQVMRLFTTLAAAKFWLPPAMLRMNRMVLDAHDNVDAIPSSASSINGTTFTFDGDFRRSALLFFDRGRVVRRRCVTVTPWLHLTVVPVSGQVYAWIRPWKMDWHARVAREIQVRFSAKRSRLPAGVREHLEEVWWSWSLSGPQQPGFVLSTFSTEPCHGDMSKMEQCVRHGIESLRVDVFYHRTTSILERPLTTT